MRFVWKREDNMGFLSKLKEGSYLKKSLDYHFRIRMKGIINEEDVFYFFFPHILLLRPEGVLHG
jgi:hypothetical protein